VLSTARALPTARPVSSQQVPLRGAEAPLETRHSAPHYAFQIEPAGPPAGCQGTAQLPRQGDALPSVWTLRGLLQATLADDGC